MKSRREDKQTPTKAEMLSRHLLVQNYSRFWSRYKVNDLDGSGGSPKCNRKIGQYAHYA